MKQRNTENRRHFSTAERLILILAGAVFLVSAFFLIRRGISCAETRRTAQEVRSLHDSVTDIPDTEASPPVSVPEPTETAAPAYGPVTPALFAYADRRTPSPSPAPMGRLLPYYQDTNRAVLSRMDALYAVNGDIAGWLTIDGMVDLPVMYRDNSYYLTHDFYGRENAAGTLFLDESTPVAPKTQLLLIHGHNMKDGTMFAYLPHYESSGISFLKQHPFAVFSTLYKEETYVVWAVCHVSVDYSDEDYLPYWGISSFSSVGSFERYIEQLRDASLYSIPVEVSPEDALMILSTCMGEDRLIVCLRRVRNAEWTDQLNRQINAAAVR